MIEYQLEYNAVLFRHSNSSGKSILELDAENRRWGWVVLYFYQEGIYIDLKQAEMTLTVLN